MPETLYRNAIALETLQYKKSGTDVLLGAYLQANASYHFSPRWSLTAYARYVTGLRSSVRALVLAHSAWTPAAGVPG
jgi:outer membrane scaffolding protein for murein synthesis (MipA/OmpV family)